MDQSSRFLVNHLGSKAIDERGIEYALPVCSGHEHIPDTKPVYIHTKRFLSNKDERGLSWLLGIPPLGIGC